jgi:hypothetical protein
MPPKPEPMLVLYSPFVSVTATAFKNSAYWALVTSYLPIWYS